MTNNTKKLKEIDDAIEGLGNQLNDLKLAFPNLDLDNNVICLTALKHMRESVAAMEEGELLPCPMSGKKAYLLKEGLNYEGRNLYYVICHKSGIKTKNYIRAKEAIKAWNTRATGDTLKQFMEE